MIELQPIFDVHKSFYRKAHTDIVDGILTLYTYKHPVAYIEGERASVQCPAHCLSNTTLRHIKEFLKQNGFKADTKQQIINDYYVEI